MGRKNTTQRSSFYQISNTLFFVMLYCIEFHGSLSRFTIEFNIPTQLLQVSDARILLFSCIDQLLIVKKAQQMLTSFVMITDCINHRFIKDYVNQDDLNALYCAFDDLACLSLKLFRL